MKYTSNKRNQHPLRHFLIFAGWLCVGLGIIGAVLPILPTTPFLILAAYFFSKGSPHLHHWLLSRPHFGPSIRDWEERGVIRPRAKKLASVAILVTFANTLIILQTPMWVKLIIGAIGTLILAFIWTRPSGEMG